MGVHGELMKMKEKIIPLVMHIHILIQKMNDR